MLQYTEIEIKTETAENKSRNLKRPRAHIGARRMKKALDQTNASQARRCPLVQRRVHIVPLAYAYEDWGVVVALLFCFFYSLALPSRRL